jgi:uncharacterized protein GlcG (DUF336 family)
MKYSRWIFMGMIASSLAATAQAELPDSKILTLDVARAIANAAMDACHARNYKVTVLVVDSLNEPKYMLRDDGAAAVTAEIARMTATTAMVYNHPSAPGPGASPDGISTSFVEGTLKAQGAVPIKVGQATIGALAVEGAPKRAENVVCANEALAKVASLLR